MTDTGATFAILACIFLIIYFVAYFALNARWDRSRISAEIEAGGGTVLDIGRAPFNAFRANSREYRVRYVEADGTRRDRLAVTSFWMGVAWRDAPPASSPESRSTLDRG